jgi:geranylgeranyl pyrophosphate synthase
MDNSKMRKGKRTTHLVFGESTAILSALYLLEKGRLLIYQDASRHLKGKNLDKFQEFLTKNLIKLLWGQEMDLRANKNSKELVTMMQNKNGMFYLACVIPSYFMNKKYFKKLNSVSKEISKAYQYFDDLRDIQPSSITGKPTMQDKNKKTFLSKNGEKETRKKLEVTKKNILNKLHIFKPKNTVQDLVEYILSRPS